MAYKIPVDDSNIRPYLCREVYRVHWVYEAFVLQPGARIFEEPSCERRAVRACFDELLHQCEAFTFRNHALVESLFGHALALIDRRGAVLPVVGFPPTVGAFATLRGDRGYAVIDLGNVVEKRSSAGKTARDVLHDLLTHELVHLLIGVDHPPVELPYRDYLDLMAFHEGFAHLLSYRDDIALVRPVEQVYEQRFASARARLSDAITESNPERQKRLAREAIGGPYWEKFAAVAAMLYLWRHTDDLGAIYDRGPSGFCDVITAYTW